MRNRYTVSTDFSLAKVEFEMTERFKTQFLFLLKHHPGNSVL